MAIPVICPGCDADYSVPENLLGKSIRCKKCGETIAVKAPARAAVKVASRDLDDERPRKAVARRRDDDEDDDFAAEKKSGGSSMILIGGVAFLLLAVSAVGAIFLFKGDEKEVVSNDPPTKQVDPSRVPVDTWKEKDGDTKLAEPAKADDKKADDKKTSEVKADDNKADDKKADDKKADDKKTDESKAEPAKTPEKKAEDKTAKKDEPAKTTSMTDKPVTGMVTTPGGSLNGLSYERYRSGDMDPVTLAMVKKASVYIFCESDGSAGTGSGWFGLEPGLVFTNAHVLHMTAPNAPPPKQIKFYLNSGTPEERYIPHSKIKILAVDRDIDLAVLQVINEPDLPTPLKVRPSLECSEGLKLSTVGYPFGAGPDRVIANSSGNPTVSVRTTALTSFKFNDYRQIRRIQLEGGANTGNSGGPVVDAEGAVCTVIVQGYHGSGLAAHGVALTFGVPTEYCFGILAGRIGEVNTAIAYKDGDKVRIPIKIKCLDPLNRLQSVGVAGWIGNPPSADARRARMAGKEKPKSEVGDRDYTEVMLKYDNKTKMAVGELVLPAKPDGTVYWYQPFYTNPIVSRYWDAGLVYNKSNEPAERIPTNLTFKGAGKSRVVTMSTASTRGEEAAGDGESKNERQLLRFGLTVAEDAAPPDANDPNMGAKLRLRFLSLLMPKVVQGNATQDALPPLQFAKLNEEVKKCGAIAVVNKEGVIYQRAVNTINVPDLNDKLHLVWFTNEAMEALEATALMMPNKMVNPDETWTWTRDNVEKLPYINPFQHEIKKIIEAAGGKFQLPKQTEYRYKEERTYKYIGVRTREGRQEAMVLIEGKMSKAPGTSYGSTGSVSGWAAIDLNSGVVLEATLERDFEIDTSSKGVKKHAYGVMVYKISRSAPN